MPKRKSTELEGSSQERTPKKKAKVLGQAMPPSRYTQQQDRMITEFVQVTRADKTSAARILRQAGWHLPTAIESFFGSARPPNLSQGKISKLFDGYREDPKDAPNEINFEGVGKLLGDLGIGLEDIGSLYVFELVRSPVLGRFTREGFIGGLLEEDADDVSKVRRAVATRQSTLRSGPYTTQVDPNFKRVYNHTFTLMIEDRKKAIDLDQAVDFWKVLFSESGYQWTTDTTPWLDWYIEFLTTKWNKAINKDLWRQTLAFAEASTADEQLTFWNEESSWPSVIDEFVGWVKEKRATGEAMDVE